MAVKAKRDRNPEIALLRVEAAAWLLNELVCGEHAIEPTEENLEFGRQIAYEALLDALGDAQAAVRRDVTPLRRQLEGLGKEGA
jgi:hypothetical protein